MDKNIENTLILKDEHIKYIQTSDRLRIIRKNIPQGNITIKTLVDTLINEGVYLLIIILVAPFLFPVSIPGSSTPFGVLIILLNFSILSNGHLHLPKFISKQVLATETIDKFFDILHKALSYVELISKPRGKLVTNKHILKINAVITIILAFLLFLPLPIPFTDFIPSVAILLLAVSSLENDSYLMIIGYVATVITLAYFYSVGYIGVEIIRAVLNTILAYI